MIAWPTGRQLPLGETTDGIHQNNRALTAMGRFNFQEQPQPFACRQAMVKIRLGRMPETDRSNWVGS